LTLDITAVQQALADLDLAGWLLFDNHGSNPIAAHVLGLPPDRMATRRWFYLIPRTGEPKALLHAIEPQVLGDVPGARLRYRSWRELEASLGEMLVAGGRVAMEYSPEGAIPYVSRVDAGTVELVRKAGADVASSADLVQLFEARWTPRQRQLHDRAASEVLAAKDAAFARVRERLAAGRPVSESELQAYVGERFAASGLVTDHPCIVAVNEHAADPHFEPSPGADDRPIGKGDLLLLDLWAKLAGEPDAVYYDTTWMAFCGSEVPARMQEVWEVVRGARDAAVVAVRDAVRAHRPIRGADVDDVARGHIEARGFGPYFLHRTGHSIGTEVHANGVNIDNLETRDERTLIPGVAFSIEPGIYLPEFGIRSEIVVQVTAEDADVTGDSQAEITLLR